PGSDDVAEPGEEDRLAARRGGPHPPRRDAEGGAPPVDPDPQGGRDPEGGGAHRRLSASVLGRYATARDDRDGADQQPGRPDRGRADDGTRRDDPGADSQADGA